MFENCPRRKIKKGWRGGENNTPRQGFRKDEDNEEGRIAFQKKKCSKGGIENG
jgi:hypothetical protein